MDSFGDINLYQMVIDYIEQESSPIPHFSTPSKTLPQSEHQKKCCDLKEILQKKSCVEVDLMGAVLKHMKILKSDQTERKNTSSVKKWLVECLKEMDGFSASLCKSSWPSTWTSLGGFHEYINIVIKDEEVGEIRIIIDTDFKSQFKLARETTGYNELCKILPEIYVGEEKKLEKVISIVCPEAKKSLKESGFNLPPWRTVCYMQAKWFTRCKEKDSNPSKQAAAEGAVFLVEGVVFPWELGDKMVRPIRRRFAAVGCVSGLSIQFAGMSTECK